MLKILNQKKIRGIMPEEFSQSTMYSVIGNLIDPDLNATSSNVILNFSGLKKIGIGGVAVLSNVIELLRSSGVEVSFEGLVDCDAREILETHGFISMYANDLLGENNPKRDKSILPLSLVSSQESNFYVLNKVIPWMRTHLGLTRRDQLATATATIQEIFNNISDHSDVNIGCVCGSVNQDANTINLCISDFGVGIPKLVKQSVPSIIKDSLSIAKACEEGFTTKSTPRNRGVGLYFLLKNTVELNGGTVFIYSGRGRYKSQNNNNQRKTSVFKASEGFYPGTLIFMTLPIDRFVPDEPEEFNWDEDWE
ncbi:MAG: hypothetical protein PHN76_05915 [Advenella sp.]|uniref:hypothetical protein n=1 Tax=Advenella sp. TaxID=1872388 RepID=UPI002583CFBE|nr:hypothetical protein [Advenella sp.]MDD3757682.1 hypothetical protein [Advenella sp.]